MGLHFRIELRRRDARLLRAATLANGQQFIRDLSCCHLPAGSNRCRGCLTGRAAPIQRQPEESSGGAMLGATIRERSAKARG